METASVSPKRKVSALLVVGLILLVLALGTVVVIVLFAPAPSGNVLSQNLSEPLNDVTSAKVDINAGTGNLSIDGLNANVPLLASAAVEYPEKQSAPDWTVKAFNGKADVTLKADGGRQAGLRLPWQACNGETNWQIHLNGGVASDLTAYSGGGNLKLDLSGMNVTGVMADTGGGNVDVVLPEQMQNLSVTAKTGAGNVTVYVPNGVEAKIHATSGVGKVMVDSRFTQVDENTYQSAGYDGATNRVEITLGSGAGNVSVNSK
jgi:DUF4097 and DUF4098 domain-containing protein YvlB